MDKYTNTFTRIINEYIVSKDKLTYTIDIKERQNNCDIIGDFFFKVLDISTNDVSNRIKQIDLIIGAQTVVSEKKDFVITKLSDPDNKSYYLISSKRISHPIPYIALGYHTVQFRITFKDTDLSVIQSQLTGINIESEKRNIMCKNTCLFGEKLEIISGFGFGGHNAEHKQQYDHYEICPGIHISKDKEPENVAVSS